jgi:hypothetical protein
MEKNDLTLPEPKQTPNIYVSKLIKAVFSIALMFVANLINATPACTGHYLHFDTQPTVSMPMAQDEPATVVVHLLNCADNTLVEDFYGEVTLTVKTGCGFVARTIEASGGIATFDASSGIVFTRSPQTGVTLEATSPGQTSGVSEVFDVLAPVGSPITEILARENFEEHPGAPTWHWTVGTPVYSGIGNTGQDWTTVKTFPLGNINGTGPNKVLAKSYTTENLEPQKLSTTTITFDHITSGPAPDYVPLSDYTNLTLKFKIASLFDANSTPKSPDTDPSQPSGGQDHAAGVDPGENMSIEVYVDGAWHKVLSYLIGTKNYMFSLSTSNRNLMYNANAIYTQPKNQSAFTVFIDIPTSSVALRMTAANNRPPENWVIDDIVLEGERRLPGMRKPLPTALGTSMLVCPNIPNTLSVVTLGFESGRTYKWAPLPTAPTPQVNYFASGDDELPSPNITLPPNAAMPYELICTVKDEDNCSDTGRVTLLVPGATIGTWMGSTNQDWFLCENWGKGVVPTETIDVTIEPSSMLFPEINPASPFAPPSGLASAKSISLNDTLWMHPNATLVVRNNFNINFTGGVNYGRFDMSAGASHTSPNTLLLGGNWTNNAYKTPSNLFRIGFIPGRGRVIFNGTNLQTVVTKEVKEGFYELEVNKNSGFLNMMKDVDIAKSLIMTNGIINAKVSIDPTDGYDTLGLLTLDTAATASGSPGTSSYVNGLMIKRTNGNLSNISYLLPIGKSTNPAGISKYQPIYIHPTFPTSGLGITTYRAEFVHGNPAIQYPQSALDASLMGIWDNRYWVTSKTGAANAAARVGFEYPAIAPLSHWALVPNGDPGSVTPTAPDNVAVAQNNSSNWAFTKAANDFDAVGPLYETRNIMSAGRVYSAPITSFGPFTIGFGQSIILPIKLLSFNGRLQGVDGYLSWEIADNNDLAGFVLEYSTTGGMFYKLADLLPGSSVSYHYLHQSLPSGTHYYRLLVKEKNGNKYHSSVVAITVGQLATQIKGLTNTLAKTKLGVKILSATNQSVEARITDVLGRQVTQYNGSILKGYNQWQVPTQLLSKGMYFITVQTKDGVRNSLQFVKE